MYLEGTLYSRILLLQKGRGVMPIMCKEYAYYYISKGLFHWANDHKFYLTNFFHYICSIWLCSRSSHSSISPALTKSKVVWLMSQLLNREKMTFVIHFYEIICSWKFLAKFIIHEMFLRWIVYRFLHQLQLSNGKFLSMHPETRFHFSQLSIRLLITT